MQINIFRIQAHGSVMCGYFALDLLTICLLARLWLTIPVCFHRIIKKKTAI